MLKNIQVLCLTFLFFSCATYQPKYKFEQTQKFKNAYSEDQISQSFYLIGDTGNKNLSGVAPGLKIFNTFIQNKNTESTKLLILGDNIYPKGMPSQGDENRPQAETVMNSQLQVLKDFQGDIHFIPGNHDWYIEGIQALENQKDFIEKGLPNQDQVWLPKPGCGMSFVDISDDVHLIILDSQWILEDWDDNPKINRNCDEIKTRSQFYEEFETELKKNQNKTTLVALHHPLYSNGIHGGTYEFTKHLFPSQKKVPLPILGSLVNMIRTTGGISVQDTQNNQYRAMVDRISAIASRWNRVVFASGHEHNLQYIEHDLVKQIVSGSASKVSYAKLGNDGLFASPEHGFAKFDVLKDGSSWVSFYAENNGKIEKIYQKEVYPKPETFDLDQLPNELPEFVEASIYDDFKIERTDFYESLWGERYRNMYGKKLKLKVLDLDSAYGGLEPIRMGGGMQTNSLRLKDSLGREYNIRQIKKNPIRLLQQFVYPDKNLTGEFDETIVEEVLLDFLTSAHPFSFMAVPDLAEAIDVYHTNPELYYIPKQKALGKFNAAHGDAIYMIEERPEEHWKGTEGVFSNPNHDIVSTSDVFERLRRDEKYSVDESSYLRARLFDMLLGDWDRHEDQWRWSEFEDEDGNHTFKPIPRDRDQVFANFDGGFFNSLRSVASFPRIYQPYSEDIKYLKWLNNSGLGLDRTIIRNATGEDWLAEAEFIQNNLTDEVINSAFSNFPKEIDAEETEKLKQTFKARLGNLKSIAERYYGILSEYSMITATDKDDFIDVFRQEDGSTRVKIMRNIKGEREYTIVDKTFSPEDTKEIWIYGLDDDDIFQVEGDHKSSIKVRLIGGHGDDEFKIKSGQKTVIYDYKTLENTIEEKDSARLVRSDQYKQNVFDKDRKISRTNVILPRIGFNPDDGLLFGVQDIYTFKGFQLNPFTFRHKLNAGFYTATGGFDFGYQGEFANVLGEYNLHLGLHYTSPNFAQNFFGIGNNTPNFDDDLGRDFNRVKIRMIETAIGLTKRSEYGSVFQHEITFENYRVQRTAGRFLDQIGEDLLVEDPDFFESKNFAGLETAYQYQSFDNNLNPKRGMDFQLEFGGKLNLDDTKRNFLYLNPSLEFFNSISGNKKLVLRSKAQSQLIFDDTYEFYQGATLGANNGLRGYRKDRFIGQQSLVGNFDLRYSFNQIKTALLPVQLGVFAGTDVGRVWSDVQNESETWHHDYGLGFWLNGADLFTGTFNFFHSEDGFWFSFGFGASF
ncbi:metallophosphoesterase [Psychroflexus aestuariivivens]|uniref:metallophosphoesterase n=1 Tax=Psychroflexus aestuariivivens TaxID=1795040 RepID=UPI000FD6C078|nr:metallophosphoesterase [Psychroflexus aestuariivivens]